MAVNIPWEETIVTLSIHPNMAEVRDVARLAADLMAERAARRRAEAEAARCLAYLAALTDDAGRPVWIPQEHVLKSAIASARLERRLAAQTWREAAALLRLAGPAMTPEEIRAASEFDRRAIAAEIVGGSHDPRP